MELAVHPNELLLLYNSNSSVSRKTLAFARTISKNIRYVEFGDSNLPNTIWKELLNMLHMNAKDILDKSHPEYKEKIRGHEYTSDGWLNILSHNTHLIKAPIAIKNKKAILCVRPKDVLKVS